MTLTVAEDGWKAVRRAVFARDGGCVATNRQFSTDWVAVDDPCRDGFGNELRYGDWDHLEFDHVREKLGGARLDDEAHGIGVCPWHHRLSTYWRSDTSYHRAAAREWLRKHYPEVWT